ncbi:MAG TPA: DUF4230 domain-containing protein [Acidimicrobiales bacterium]|nr:DUF4230 domain-containing protein [Acidimicrobiales bacterium]
MTIIDTERPATTQEPHRYPPPPGRRPRSLTTLVVAGVVLLGLFLGLGALRDLLPDLRNPFRTETVDRTQPAVLKALEDLREYRAASGHFEVIVDLEKDARYIPALIKGERTLFVAVGTVEAGVDFSRLGEGAVVVSEDRQAVTVTLPHARLSPPRVDPGRSYVFERERGVLDRLGAVFSDNPTSERPLYMLAERRLAAAARGGSGLVERAEANTRAMLEGLLRSLGFTQVDVHFA